MNAQGPHATSYLRYAAHCYLQGLRLGCPAARDLLPRLLHLLSFEDPAHGGGWVRSTGWWGARIWEGCPPARAHTHTPKQPSSPSPSPPPPPGVVGEELGQATENGKDVPLWVWVPWAPQLLTSLTRPEASCVKPILRDLAVHHPQALYYSLRTCILTAREPAMRAKEVRAGGGERWACAAHHVLL